MWESDANGSFTIDEWNPDAPQHRGTRIVLSMKEDQMEYLEEHKIRSLVKKHNQFISHPVELYVSAPFRCQPKKPTETSTRIPIQSP